MKLNCPTGDCAARCPILNLPQEEQGVAVALAETAFTQFSASGVTEMSRETREALLTAEERRKSDDVPQSERISSPQAYALIATAMHRHAINRCRPQPTN